MKEIIAIIRPGKDRATKDALKKVGISVCTSRRVFGRGRQKGLRYAAADTVFPMEQVVMRYLPKKMLYLVVTDRLAETAVNAIIRANQTGRFGDGKIFVADVGAAQRIRTGEKGDKAVQ